MPSTGAGIHPSGGLVWNAIPLTALYYSYKIIESKKITMRLIETERGIGRKPPSRTEDPVLAMLGVGQQLWEHEAGNQFVERLRSEDLCAPPSPRKAASSAEDLSEAVWRVIQNHQGEQFHTVRGLPFTFEVQGNGIWFFRDRKRVNRKSTRTQIEVAISRCPLKSTTEIKDLMDYPYLFALLMDRRIRGHAW
jgi:hypothetical protein